MSEKAKVEHVLVHGLQIAVFNVWGKQVPELQRSVVSLFAEHMERCGYTAEGTVVEDNNGRFWRIRKDAEGNWNYELVYP